MSNGTAYGRVRRTLIIVLVCSVAFNLLFIGGLAGRYFSGPPSRPFPSQLGWVMSELDDETQQKLKPIMRKYATRAKPLRREMARAQKQFEQALTANPMDEEQVNLALRKLQQSAEENQFNLHQQLISIMKEMNPEDRKKALRYLHLRGPGHSRRNRKGRSHSVPARDP